MHEKYWSEQQIFFAVAFSGQPASISLYKDDSLTTTSEAKGENYDKLFITHEDLMNGGMLEFFMGDSPNSMEEAVRP